MLRNSHLWFLILSRSCSSDLDQVRILWHLPSTMGIALNLRSATLKPEAVAADSLLPDDEMDENSPRALYGTDSAVASSWKPISSKAKRPRRTANVVIEERWTWQFVNVCYCNFCRLGVLKLLETVLKDVKT